VIEGYYTAASAMAAMLAEQQIIGNNLANLNTVGYKQDVPRSSQFEEVLLLALRRDPPIGAVQARHDTVGTLGTGVELLPVVLDLTPGPIRETGRALDLAIPDVGFFRLLGADGQDRFARAGAFDRDVDGTVVNRQGEKLLDVNGQPIVLGEGTISILSDGSIFLDGNLVTQIALTDLPEGQDWKKSGLSHFEPVAVSQVPDQVQSPRMLQGFLEQANVDSEFQMVEMLSVLRVYEAAQVILKTEDESIAQAVREVGRVE